MEDSAFQLVLPSKLECVYEISVVRDGECALYVADGHGLTVRGIYVTCCGVAYVTDCYPALTELRKNAFVKHFVHKSKSLVSLEHAAVVDNDAAAFLTSVLKRIQSEISGVRHVGRRIAINAEYAAFLVYIT